MKKGKNDESDTESEQRRAWFQTHGYDFYAGQQWTGKALEQRVIALERGLEAVLRRLEESGQPEDEPGWYGRPE